MLLFIIFLNIFLILNFKIKKDRIIYYQKKIIYPEFFKRYKYSIENYLSNLDYPFKLNFTKYCFIKYILSIVVFIVSSINYSNCLVPVILFLFVFFIPNILLKRYSNSINIKLIGELKNINTNFILSISAFVPFREAIMQIPMYIEDAKIKIKFEKFVHEYSISNYILKKPADNLMNKFQSNLLTDFLQILIQSENEGNVIECLERFNATLNLNYSKYVNFKLSNQMLYLVFGIILMLGNVMLLTLYPVVYQILQNFEIMF